MSKKIYLITLMLMGIILFAKADDPVTPSGYAKKVVSISDSPVISKIGINWGWGSYYNLTNSKTWYSLTGEWIPKNKNYGFNNSRYMIYDIKPK